MKLGRRPRRTAFVLAILVAAGALVVAMAPPEGRASMTRLVIIGFGILGAWWLLGRSGAVTASSPERFDRALHRTAPSASDMSSLRSVETDLRMSAASAFGLEFRLKPQLRDLARWQLQRNHGIDLDRSPEAARRIVGDRLWRLILPADEAPEFRQPGVGLAEVQAGIERLERI